MNFAIKTFNELTIDELYEIVKSRFEVFVCEQKIVEDQEFDDKDKVSYHIMLKENDKVVKIEFENGKLICNDMDYVNEAIKAIKNIEKPEDNKNKGAE